MAHADYSCCAICDCKLEYYPLDAPCKERICESCLLALQVEKLNVVTVSQFMDFVKEISGCNLKDTLKRLHYRLCYYHNEVDETVEKLGVKFGNDRYVKEDA